MILETAKARGFLPYVMKVGLLVADMTQFKALNAEYVKYFGLRPPVRVCIQIPGDEVIAFFIRTANVDDEGFAHFRKIQQNLHV